MYCYPVTDTVIWSHKILRGIHRWKIVLEISCQLCFNKSIKNSRNNDKRKALFRA